MPDIYLTPAIEEILAIPGIKLIVNFSGGKDSESTLHALHARYGATHDIRLAYADTGNEYEDDPEGRWVSAAHWCIQRSAYYGLPLTIVRNPKRTLQQEVLERKRFPSPGQRWCTAHHKRGPLEKYLRSLDADHIVSIKGIRADESDSRANQPPWEVHRKLTVKRTKKTGRARFCWTWLPIHKWSFDDVLSYVGQHKLPLHPIYQFQERFSCEWCFYYTPKHIAAMYEHNRRAFDECHALELATNFTMSPTRKFLPQIVAEYKAKGLQWTPQTEPYARRYHCDY